MAKRAKRRVEAVRAWGCIRLNGMLSNVAYRSAVDHIFPTRALRVRILRESDYKALLKAAKEAK